MYLIALLSYAKKLFHPDKTGTFLAWVLQARLSDSEDVTEVNIEVFCSIIGLLLAPEFTSLHVAAMLALPSVCKHLIDVGKVDPNLCCRIGTPLHALLAGTSLLGGLRDLKYDSEFHFRDHAEPDPVAYDQLRKCLKLLLENGADTSICWNTTSIFEVAVNNSVQNTGDEAWMYPLINASTVMITDSCIGDFWQHLSSGDINKSFLHAIMELGSTSDILPGWARLASLVQTWRMESEHAFEAGIPSLGLQVRVSDEDFADTIRISIEQNMTDTLAALVEDSRFSPDMHKTDIHYFLDRPLLHLAIQSGNMKSVELLLNAGCDIQVANDFSGWTSLHECADAVSGAGNAAITTLIIESGALISAKNNQGKTCWHLAAQNGDFHVLEVLIGMNCDSRESLTTTSNEGRTPLASAILEKWSHAATLLLDQCHEEPRYFKSDQSLLDQAAAIGSETLFRRLHEKLKEAEEIEEIESSKPFDHIDEHCSPDLLDYLLDSWLLDSNLNSNTLIT